MIREERYLEAETYSAEEEAERDRLGTSLMAFGRRITDIAEEYVPKVKDIVYRYVKKSRRIGCVLPRCNL